MIGVMLKYVEREGYAIAFDAVPQELLWELDQALDAGHAGTRNLLSVPAVRELATSDPLRRLVEPVLGPHAFGAGHPLQQAAGGELEGSLSSGIRHCNPQADGFARLGAVVNEGRWAPCSPACRCTGPDAGSPRSLGRLRRA